MPQLVIVLHQQNSLSSRTSLGLTRQPRSSLNGTFDPGQVNPHGGPDADGTLDVDMAVMLFHDAVHSRQSQASTFALPLGCEEGIKHLSLGVRVHSAPRVVNTQHHITAWPDSQVPASILFVKDHVGRNDGEPATVRHGVTSID